jgi:hypothetical protein
MLHKLHYSPPRQMVSGNLDLAARCLIHADKADDAGLYTTANVLWLAAQALKADSMIFPAIKAAAYAQGREDAAKVCEAEQLLDPQDASDEGYMRAIDHCAAAIRAAP